MPVRAGEVVVHRIVAAVRNVGRNVVGIDMVLVQHREQQAAKIFVERGRHAVTARKCQVVDPGQGLTEPEQGSRHLVRRRLNREDTFLFVNPSLANNLLA